MLRILVADDERITRKGLLLMLQRDIKEDVEWLQAANGVEALKLVQQRPVDLIITDICMPLCSGLEFVEQLRESKKDMTVIIISGYANFEYAKQAVRLGVKDYIMKPVKTEEFLNLVEQCIADIQKKKQDAKQEALRQLRIEQITDQVQMESLRRLLEGTEDALCWKALEEAGVSRSESGFCCAVLEYEISTGWNQTMDLAVREQAKDYLAKRKVDVITTVIRPGCIAMLFYGMVARDKDTQQYILSGVSLRIERLYQTRAVCGVGEMVYDVEQISMSFAQSTESADCKLCGDRKQMVFFHTNGGESTAEPLFSPTLLEHWEPGCTDQILHAFECGMEQQPVGDGIGRLRTAYEMVYREARRCSEALPTEEQPQFRKFYDLWSWFELRSEVEIMLQQMNSTVEEASGAGGKMTREIIHYTIDHITEDIDLNYLAAHFGKTPGYIGKLFRKGSQMGFNEFVTNERVKLAKRLLTDQKLSIQQVARLCGYYNPKYFSTAFKKVTGMSPKAYREKGR
ncbi:MAG: response regulator [Eubacteriales bacterium]|nr:response regulator [Eubacteriales bacterium]